MSNVNINEIIATLNNKENILNNVKYHTVNRKKYEKFENTSPAQFLGDLATYYTVNVGEDRNVYVTYSVMDHYDITLAELDKAARKNSNDFKITNMAEVLAELTGMPVDTVKRDSGEPDITVFTNTETICGACILMYPSKFYNTASKAKDDLIIIPSSIHEVLGIPASTLTIKDAMQMLREVNANEVSEDARLSNNIYYYSKSANGITMVTTDNE